MIQPGAGQPGNPGASGLSLYHIAMLALAPVCVFILVKQRWPWLDAHPLYPAWMSGFIGTGLAIAMFGAQIIGGALAGQIAGIDPSTTPDTAEGMLRQHVIVMLGAYGAASGFVIWLAIEDARRGRGQSTSQTHRRRPSIRAALTRAAAFFMLIWPVLTSVSIGAAFIHQAVTGEEPPGIAHGTLQAIADSQAGPWLIMMLLSVLLGAPIIEETMYRGLLQRGMRTSGLPPWGAILITSVIFTAMHGAIAAPFALASLFVLSLGLGLIYEKTGHLLAPIVVHVLFNATNVALVFAMKSAPP